MSNKGTLRFRMGLFVILAALLFAALIVMFGSLPTLFKVTTKYSVRFVDAPGLTPGAPVRRSGVRIGEVQDIVLDEERGIVIAKLAIDAPYSLRHSEVPTLVTGLLGSDTSIDLIPKPSNEKQPIDRSPIEPGSELVGTRAATMNTLLKGASEVVPTTQETLNDIRKSIQRLERLAGRAEKTLPILEDTLRDYRDLARQAMPELEKTGSEIRELVRSARAVVPEVEKTAREYRLLGQDLRSTVPQIQRTAEDFGQLARDANTALPEIMKTNKAIQEVARGAKDALPGIERTVDEIGALASDVRKTVPTVRAAVDDVAATARGAGKLIEEFDIFWQKNRDTLEQSLNNLNRTLKQTADLVSDENVRKINRTITNVTNSSDQLPKISQNVLEVSEEMKTTLKNLNDVLKEFERTLTDLRKVTKPIGERSERIAKNTDESLERLNSILGDVKALMTVLDRSNGTFRKLLTDSSIYNNLDSAVVNAIRLIPRLDRILKDFEVFADKLARHPELIGVGGAIKKSDGLKNPPTPPINGLPPHR